MQATQMIARRVVNLSCYIRRCNTKTCAWVPYNKYFNSRSQSNNCGNVGDINNSTIVTDEDIKVMQSQLKRKVVMRPEKIIKRCKWGYPQVAFNSSAVRTPVPTTTPPTNNITSPKMTSTLAWLLCPRIDNMISKQEVAGGVAHFENRIANDASFRQEVERGHEIFRDRWAKEQFLSTPPAASEEGESQHQQQQHQQKQLQRYEQWRQFTRFGNAGTKVPQAVKCLHANMAAYLGGHEDDAVGRQLFRDLVDQVREEAAAAERNNNNNNNDNILQYDDKSALDCPASCIQCAPHNRIPAAVLNLSNKKRRRSAAGSATADPTKEE